MPSKQMWAIVGNAGLYIGTWQRRGDAIAQHIHDKRLPGEPELSRWPDGWGKLSPEQKEIWRRHQRLGDRAVKVTVTWE